LFRSGAKPISETSVENRSLSAANAFCAVNIAFKFTRASDCFERAWNLLKLGTAMALRMPTIATATINSMRVNPLRMSFRPPVRRRKRAHDGRNPPPSVKCGFLRPATNDSDPGSAHGIVRR